MKAKVFIDGSEGTTGLKIYERFANRSDIEFIRIDEDKRKDAAARAECINASDYTFLCLPDAAAVESASLCTNPAVRILDASTAHRTAAGWDYGFPELSRERREAIRKSRRVAVPGCYASGFVSIAAPLVAAGVMPPDYPAVCHAVSGYSGGGKKAISQYEDDERLQALSSPRLYALSQKHKHIPEMTLVGGLEYAPVFCPYICDYFSGMAVTVMLHTRLLNGAPIRLSDGAQGMSAQGTAASRRTVTALDVWSALAKHYEGEHFVRVAPFMGEGVLDSPFIAANALAGTNRMMLYVCGNDERVTVTSVFDNLGKGASGAAVQCMNIMMGIDEGTGLE